MVTFKVCIFTNNKLQKPLLSLVQKSNLPSSNGNETKVRKNIREGKCCVLLSRMY
jgi:hypothetical protein